MSSYVPSIHVPTEPRLPLGWPDDTVEKLLNAVDRSSPTGKRDYAILMVAARLGLRPEDIRTLTLDHLRWAEARIVRCQSKTGYSISLPLTQEVGAALIDYLKNGRPASTHREVFLQMQPPFNPIRNGNALNKIISVWRVRGGIEFPKEARTSMYALRHSVACRLQEAGTPIETIAAILGHASTDTTRVYARVDITTLRTVALDPVEVCHA